MACIKYHLASESNGISYADEKLLLFDLDMLSFEGQAFYMHLSAILGGYAVLGTHEYDPSSGMICFKHFVASHEIDLQGAFELLIEQMVSHNDATDKCDRHKNDAPSQLSLNL